MPSGAAFFFAGMWLSSGACPGDPPLEAVRLRRAAAFLLAVALLAAGPAARAACPERPPCRGCGCKGGPGYRGPDGRCVGFKDLARTCGDPPTTRCTFENAPGTGENRACALEAPKPKDKGTPADGAAR